AIGHRGCVRYQPRAVGRDGRNRRRGAPPMVDAPSAGRLAESPLELVDGLIKRRVEVLGSGLTAHNRPACAARDLHVLTPSGLPWVLLVMELDVDPADLVVVSLELGQLVGNMDPVMVRHDDVAASD